MAGNCARPRAPLARKCTNRILRVSIWHNKYKILNCIERHNFCLSDLLTNASRTTLQSCKVDERTFGTPCIRCIFCSHSKESSAPYLKLRDILNKDSIFKLKISLLAHKMKPISLKCFKTTS